MQAPEADGASRQAHLEQAAKTLKRNVEVIRGEAYRQCPPPLAYLWQDFCELAEARGANGFAPCSLSFSEIWAWSKVTGITLQAWELRTFRDMDKTWFEVYNARSSRTKHSREQSRGKGG